eukprot:392309_1
MSYTTPTSYPIQVNPIQNMKLINFDDSLIFGHLNKNKNEEKINLIIENSTSISIIKSESLCIKLSPDEAFIKIGSILRHQHACECTDQKNGVHIQKMTSEIMGVIYWAHLIYEIYQETSIIQFLTSTCLLAFSKMSIGNMKISHEMILDLVNITIWSIMKLKTNGTSEVCDFRMDFSFSNYGQSSRPERKVEQIRDYKHKKDFVLVIVMHIFKKFR